jgi:hypothetical protein
MSAEKLYSALGIRFKTPQLICELRAHAQYAKNECRGQIPPK